jgi:hypothetical protein
MGKVLLVHALVKFVIHAWNDPSMSWLPALLAVLAVCCAIWFARKLVLQAWDKLRTWRQRSEMPYNQNPL